MSIDDQKLDELLKRVDLPAGLKADLLSISQSQIEDARSEDTAVVHTEQNASNLYRYRGWIALVASIAAVLLMCFAMWPKNETSNDASTSHVTGSGDSSVIKSPATNVDQSTIEQLEHQLAELKSLRLAVEIDQLDQRIRGQSTDASGLANSLSETDVNSLCIALAADSAIASGVDIKLLESDLQFAVDQFPNSPGAKLAQQILSNN